MAASPGHASGVCDVVAKIADACQPAAALQLMATAVARLGADAGVFVVRTRDDESLTSYRFLLACDPLWANEYVGNERFADDPWLRYATRNTEPVRASELEPSSARQAAVVDACAAYGFCSALIAPAPSSAGEDRIGVLYLGSARHGYFEDDGYTVVRPLARALAMELHAWLQRRTRRDLIEQARITESDLALLRHHDAGHPSKTIAAALKLEAKTVDCRFQRLNLKLGVTNRRAAVRLAKLYGLI